MSETLQRQWAMLRMIPRAPRKLSALEIYKRLEGSGKGATLRTVQRDLHALSRSFPIVGDQSKPMGWSWRADAAMLDIPGMDNHTALTFTLVESYMQKLLPVTTLSHMRPWFQHAEDVLRTGASPMARWQDKVRVITKAPSLQSPLIDADVQAVIYDCLMQEQQIEITYQAITKDELPKTYPVHPLGIVVREQVVYLVCTIKEHVDPRFLALHRIKASKRLEQQARIPHDFDLEKVATKSLGILISEDAMFLEMKVSQLIAKYLKETPLSTDQQMTPLEDGQVLLQVTVQNSIQIRNWIYALSKDCEVLSPQFLRDELVFSSKKMQQIYGQ